MMVPQVKAIINHNATQLLLGVISAMIIAGVVGWISSTQATHDYMIRDEAQGAATNQRIVATELVGQQQLLYLQSIDRRLSRIEGKLEIIGNDHADKVDIK